MTLASVVGGERVSGMIIETEAYLGIHDPASHAWRGRRNRLYLGIWAPAGSWYVYRSYGIHWCLNLTAPTDGDGGAVLIRAVVPREGLGVMRIRRGGVADARLANGPGKLTQAFGITGAHDGLRATRRAPIRLLRRRGPFEEPRIVVSSRVGISRAVDWPLRFRARRPRTLPEHCPAHPDAGMQRVHRAMQQLAVVGSAAELVLREGRHSAPASLDTGERRSGTRSRWHPWPSASRLARSIGSEMPSAVLTRGSDHLQDAATDAEVRLSGSCGTGRPSARPDTGEGR